MVMRLQVLDGLCALASRPKELVDEQYDCGWHVAGLRAPRHSSLSRCAVVAVIAAALTIVGTLSSSRKLVPDEGAALAYLPLSCEARQQITRLVEFVDRPLKMLRETFGPDLRRSFVEPFQR